MKYKNFEEYLMSKCMEEVPATDDMYPDIYEDWIVEQDIDDIIRWANEWKENEVQKEREDAVRGFVEFLAEEADYKEVSGEDTYIELMVKEFRNLVETYLQTKGDEK